MAVWAATRLLQWWLLGCITLPLCNSPKNLDSRGRMFSMLNQGLITNLRVETCRVSLTMTRAIFSLLDRPRHSRRIYSQGISNVLTAVLPKIFASWFSCAMLHIQELCLQLTNATRQTSPCESQAFYTRLPATFLAPKQKCLSRLSLVPDHKWGYFPKFDFRGVKFHHLRHLWSGSFTFSHNWQLDWLEGHLEAFGELLLSDCEILRMASKVEPLDELSYPSVLDSGLATAGMVDSLEHNLYYSTLTWASFFDLLGKFHGPHVTIPKLKTFDFSPLIDVHEFEDKDDTTVRLKYLAYVSFDNLSLWAISGR